MKQANEELKKKVANEGSSSVDIGNVEDAASGSDSDSEDGESAEGTESQGRRKPYIKMVSYTVPLNRSVRLALQPDDLQDLGLGVFEQRPVGDPSSSAAEPQPASSSESDDDTESTTSSESSLELNDPRARS